MTVLYRSSMAVGQGRSVALRPLALPGDRPIYALMNDAAPATLRARKPDWLRVRAPTSTAFAETRALMRRLGLTTVCEEAACPNIGECWTQKHATVMILGDTCTRACAFCNVKTGMPGPVDRSSRCTSPRPRARSGSSISSSPASTATTCPTAARGSSSR